MQQPPLSVIQAWPKPNYVDPETRGNSKIVLNVVLYSILIWFISLRIFCRTYLKKAFGADDFCILLAIIPTTAFFIISVLADSRYYWIRHVYDIPVENVTGGLKMVLAAECMFALGASLTKLSMLMLVRRLLASASLLWRRITSLAIIVVSIQGTVFCITVVFQCRPPQDYWKVTIDPQPNCINQAWSLLLAGIINTGTDFAVVLLPIRTVWALQLPRRQTIIVVALFALGFISCGAGIARTYYMWMVTKTWDQTWASFPVWTASAVELYIGVICASVPATKPFFSTYLPQVFGSIPSIASGYSSSRLQSAPYERNTNSGYHEEELLTFEKAIRGVEGTSSTKTVCRVDSSRKSDEENFIRVRQTVDMVTRGS